MNNCKECDKPATIGSYCLAHHLERTNAIITAQFAIERATTAERERERDEARAQLATVSQHRDALMVENHELINEADRMNSAYDSIFSSLDEARAELDRVKAERDEAQEHLVYLFDHLKVWLGAILIGEVKP